MKKTINYIFLILVWVILLLPFLAMAVCPTTTTTENTPLAEAPQLKKDGQWNVSLLSDAGAFLKDRLAFRQQLITCNSLLQSKLFGTSATDQVVLGKEGWLYYAGTLDDYLGRNLFTPWQWHALTHNLSLLQSYTQAQGSQFYLMVPPNKNSLYDQAMPSQYQKGESSNLQQLSKRLTDAGISYLPLLETFSQAEETLYFSRGSHWNNKGALAAYRLLMEQTGFAYESYRNVPSTVEVQHIGDLDEMLFPLAYEKEEDLVWMREPLFTYNNQVTDNMDAWIETRNPQAEGTLLMYRDSFGESLLPLAADAFEEGYFTRLVPYNFLQVEQYHPDVVVIEKVERNLDDFFTDMPILEPLPVANLTAEPIATDTTMQTEKNGSFLQIQGALDADFATENTELFLSIQSLTSGEKTTYPVFYTAGSAQPGYHLYLKESHVPSGAIRLCLLAQQEGNTMEIAHTDLTFCQEEGENP